MDLSIAYLAAFAVGAVVAGPVGYALGVLLTKHRVLRRMALTIDGEVHQAMHYIVADEEHARRKVKTAALTPADSQVNRSTRGKR